MSEIISPNTSIAHYTIVSKIDEGGMGEVYRARDGKLGRDVAIKVLLSSLSANSDRLNRFEQEAQAAGALNHPGIETKVFALDPQRPNLVLVYAVMVGSDRYSSWVTML